jgi:hypothetical protein
MSDNRGQLRLVAVLIALPLIAIAIWAIGGCGGGGDNSSSESTVSAEIVDAEALKERSEDEEMPIYWAGEQAGTELELSVPEEGRTYVRYLTGNAEAGDPQPNFLTIGTYAFAEPVPALEELAEKPGGVQRSVPGGGIAYFNRNGPNSVYLAYPGQEVQIEVFDPDPKRAKELATSGAIVPIK